MIEHIHVKGYRLFKDFETKLQPGINVLIGANGSGKSSLIELLRIIQSCCQGCLRPGIEPRGLPGQVFHPGGPQRIVWGVTASLRSRKECGRFPRCHYGMRVEGPASSPTVLAEALSQVSPLAKGRRKIYNAPLRSALVAPPRRHGLLFSKTKERATVYEEPLGSSASPLKLKVGEDEPALSRMTDPRLKGASGFRNAVLGWRFYGELVVHRTAQVREPQPMGRGAEVDERGENLAPALLSLFTNLQHREQRDDLVSFLKAAIPDLETLTPTPDPSGKYAVLQWRERDVNATLGASDVSDGVLRLLMLGLICCNPYPPPLICIDEPELGLHPKLLPLVGGLLQHASDRSQVIVLTHSPDLLYDMPLENIAVMRKRDGEAQIVWPRHHDLLYDILTEEIAGEKQVDEERLRLAFRSGELDELG